MHLNRWNINQPDSGKWNDDTYLTKLPNYQMAPLLFEYKAIFIFVASVMILALLLDALKQYMPIAKKQAASYGDQYSVTTDLENVAGDIETCLRIDGMLGNIGLIQ